VTVSNPGPSTTDPDTGNPVDGVASSVTTHAYLSRLPVAQLSGQVELLAEQNTTISPYTLIVPASVHLTPVSTVVDEDGHRYQVIGDPADRRGLGRRVLFRAAALRRVSDLQN
jgi:hypothetical protein